LTGASGGKMKEYCDVTIKVPEIETFKIQEFHLPIYHCLCAMLEADFFNEK
jgi:D-sedoheptulose 7-phosphate isomerase